MTLSGANTYSGGTTVSAGTLALSGSGTLGSTAADLTVNGGTLSLGSTSQTAGSVSLSSGSITSSTGTLSGTSYAVSGGTLSAKLAGSGAMTVSGSSALSGDNSGWSGATTINAGTLTIGHDSALGTSNNVAVNSGGTLDIGSHTVANDVALNAGGALAGSDGTFSGSVTAHGVSSFSGSLVLTSLTLADWTSSQYTLSLGSGGTLGIDTLNLDLSGFTATTPSQNQSWTLVSSGGSTTVTLTSSANLTGASTVGGSFSVVGGSELQLVWTAVPEPATWTALAGAAALAGALWRRRGRRAVSRA